MHGDGHAIKRPVHVISWGIMEGQELWGAWRLACREVHQIF